MQESGKVYRVVQWTTGNVGAESLRGILEHPRLELAGVRVHSAEKHGVDAGELCGLGPVGVKATTDTDEILALQADAVAYMPRHADLAEVEAILRSGKNVICTPFLFDAEALPEEQRESLRAACEAGGSSVCGTGIHPGFVGIILPLTASGMVRRIRHLRIRERADWTFYDSPRITFDNMRFGHPPENATLEANPFARFNAGIFEQQIHAMARALGATLDAVETEQELVTSDEAYDVRAGRIEAGTVSGQRYRWLGKRDGEVLLEIDALWTVGGVYPESWPRPRDGWTLDLEGDPSMRLHFLSLATFERNDATIEEHVHSADIATAMQAVNAIPALCESSPGLKTAFDLMPVVSGTGFRSPDD